MKVANCHMRKAGLKIPYDVKAALVLLYLLQVLVVQVLCEPLTEAQLQLVEAQLQEVVHQGYLECCTSHPYIHLSL